MAKGSGLKAKLKLSEELAEFMGADTASRMEITKELWKYIKKHGLQNEDDKRIIEPDDVLSEIIGSKPVHMMKLAGKISAHVSDE